MFFLLPWQNVNEKLIVTMYVCLSYLQVPSKVSWELECWQKACCFMSVLTLIWWFCAMVRQNKYNLFERLLVICRPKSFTLNSIPFWLSVIQFSRSPCHNSTVKYIIMTQVFPAAQKRKMEGVIAIFWLACPGYSCLQSYLHKRPHGFLRFITRVAVLNCCRLNE